MKKCQSELISKIAQNNNCNFKTKECYKKIITNPIILDKWKYSNKFFSLSTIFIDTYYKTIVFSKGKTIVTIIDNSEKEARKTFNKLKRRFFKKRTLMYKISLFIRKLNFVFKRNFKDLSKLVMREK